MNVCFVIAYLLFAPLLGGLLDGTDRIISARMQRRKGPSILQPFYDLWRSSGKDFEMFLYYADKLAAQMEKVKAGIALIGVAWQLDRGIEPLDGQ